MLRLSKLTDYAIVVMVAMAKKPDDICSAADLSNVTHIELPTVSKILKLLAQGSLINSQRGKQGGYRLAKPSAAISMADIICVMDGPIGMTECSLSDSCCSYEALCQIRGNWQKISVAVNGALQQISLMDMLTPISPPILQFKQGHY